jgi:hypothetical protein
LIITALGGCVKYIAGNLPQAHLSAELQDLLEEQIATHDWNR